MLRFSRSDSTFAGVVLGIFISISRNASLQPIGFHEMGPWGPDVRVTSRNASLQPIGFHEKDDAPQYCRRLGRNASLQPIGFHSGVRAPYGGLGRLRRNASLQPIGFHAGKKGHGRGNRIVVMLRFSRSDSTKEEEMAKKTLAES